MLTVNCRIHLRFDIIVCNLVDLYLDLVAEYSAHFFECKTLSLQYLSAPVRIY